MAVNESSSMWDCQFRLFQDKALDCLRWMRVWETLCTVSGMGGCRMVQGRSQISFA